MPKGGFGNLIALPLQKSPRESGCSVFVDADLQQYAGRLHREHASKTDVRIIDFVDTGHPALLRMWVKRQRGYRAMGHRVEAQCEFGEMSEIRCQFSRLASLCAIVATSAATCATIPYLIAPGGSHVRTHQRRRVATFG